MLLGTRLVTLLTVVFDESHGVFWDYLMETKTADSAAEFWWRSGPGGRREPCAAPPRPGEKCPACGDADLAYDSLFVLVCPECSYVAESGAFT